jgi:hypothetical protein
MKNTFLIIVIFFLVNISFGQSYLTDQKSSSVVVGAGMTSHNYLSSFNGYLGYNYKGIFDIGVSLKKGYMAQMGDVYKIEEKSISPFMNVTLMRKNQYGAPFSLALTAEYDAFEMESNYEYTPMSGTNKIFELGARIFSFIEFSDGFAFHPAFRISYSSDQMSLNNALVSSKNYEKSTVPVSNALVTYTKAEFFIPMSFSYNGKDRIALSPSVGFSALGPEVNVTLGYIIGTSSNTKCGKKGCPVFKKR